MANKNMTKFSASQAIEEMQIKNITFSPHASQNGYLPENTTTNTGEHTGKEESLSTVGGNVN
jgi:hypothetical protein